jgi:UDP-2-acetamido-3-amino-2,3-dideoxy-glucuronate N-acetyltransferase
LTIFVFQKSSKNAELFEMKSLLKIFSFFFRPKMDYFFHPTAVVENGAEIGKGTKIWHYAHVRKSCRIGEGCVVGKSVFIDAEVKIGNHVKIQNFATLYLGLTIEDGVYIGPSVTFTNDKVPRAINPDGTPKSPSDWTCLKTHIKKGASIGANATILPGVTVGEWAMIGAGAVVTKDVPAYSVAMGNPAKVIGKVDEKGFIQKLRITDVA